MKIQTLIKIVTLLVTLLGLSQHAKAGPLLLGPADLDALIDELPAARAVDPVAALRDRLSVLEVQDQARAERRGLELALSLIHIARQNRLVPTISLTDRPALAGL